MKMNIALNVLLAAVIMASRARARMPSALNVLVVAIAPASRAHARVPSFLRDPRTVEAKEDVRRQAMGDHQLSSVLEMDAGGITCGLRLTEAEEGFRQNGSPDEDAMSLACSAVSDAFEVCRGCQGYSKMVR